MLNNLPLLMIPGMMCDDRLYTPQLDTFRSQRPIAVSDITQADTMKVLAQQVLAACEWSRFALAGLSMGGIVAMEVIRQSPERIAGLALLDTNPWQDKQEVKANRILQMETVRRGQLEQVVREQMAPRYTNAEESECQHLEVVLAMARDLGEDTFLRQSLALKERSDQSETLRQVSVPSVALCGADDQLCPIDRHETIANLIPDCVLEIIPQTGHLTTLQAPVATNIALQQWLEKLS